MTASTTISSDQSEPAEEQNYKKESYFAQPGECKTSSQAENTRLSSDRTEVVGLASIF